MKGKRSSNLSDDLIRNIVEILDGWTGSLSWDALVCEIENRIGLRYTRQALHKHERIKQAFSHRKSAIVDGREHATKRVEDPVLQLSLERIARLDAEISRLQLENANLLEQFIRWAHNAHLRGMSLDELNRPLPSTNRSQTDRKMRRTK